MALLPATRFFMRTQKAVESGKVLSWEHLAGAWLRLDIGVPSADRIVWADTSGRDQSGPRSCRARSTSTEILPGQVGVGP
jgi:hypothetical protein